MWITGYFLFVITYGRFMVDLISIEPEDKE